MLYGLRSVWQSRARTTIALGTRPWNTVPRRCFAQPVDFWEEAASAAGSHNNAISSSISTGEADSSTHGVFMGVVAARRPQRTGIEELLAQIQPTPAGSPTQPNSFPSLLVILLSPTYAQYAHSADLPLKLMDRFRPNSTASKPLDAITAVVDRLPTPNGRRKGEEGLAYAFITNPPPLDTASQSPLQLDAQKPGSLLFRIPPASPGEQSHTAIVQLPLASTIFSNGLPCSLVHTRYQFDPLSGSLRESASVQLETQALPFLFGAKGHVTEFQAPLVPLTPMRVVANCYGNIVQKLSTREDDLPEAGARQRAEGDDRIPASQELEQAVSEYFVAVGLEPQPVEVWALVSPSVAESITNFESSKDPGNRAYSLRSDDVKKFWIDSTSPIPQFTRETLDYYLERGARLAKVLSGGGGWGKKAGLLSLDPDTSYNTRHLRSEQGWDINLDDDSSDSFVSGPASGSFGEVVNSGDSIMFFIALKDDVAKTAHANHSSEAAAQSVVFGGIPSTIDEMLASSEPDIDSTSTTAENFEHFANTFGVLSEGGMALQLLQDNGSTFSRTKADVPFATLTVAARDKQRKRPLNKSRHPSPRAETPTTPQTTQGK